MKTQDQKIKDVQNYFISKILKGEFVVEKFDEHLFSLVIDEIYHFCIWVANTPEHRVPYHSIGEYFMQLNFTKKQALKCNSVLTPIIKKWKDEVLFKEKEEQFEKLKKELGR